MMMFILGPEQLHKNITRRPESDNHDPEDVSDPEHVARVPPHSRPPAFVFQEARRSQAQPVMPFLNAP